MMKKPLLFSIALMLLLTGCGMMETLVKSTFPYTTDITIPSSSLPGKEYTAITTANSFDQEFTKDGNNANQISEVRITSAKLRSVQPTNFNIGDIISIRIYMSGPDGSDEVMVASRRDITADVGNSIVLDIDNSNFLDKLIRLPEIRIRTVYVLRNNTAVDTNLKLSLGMGAEPNN